METKRPSSLDGPLSHALERRARAEVEFERAKLAVDHLLAAFDISTREAKGELVNNNTLPAGVVEAIKAVDCWVKEKSWIKVQRAD